MSITAEELARYLEILPDGAGVTAAALVRSLERIRVAAENRFQDGVVLQDALDAHRKEFGT